MFKPKRKKNGFESNRIPTGIWININIINNRGNHTNLDEAEYKKLYVTGASSVT